MSNSKLNEASRRCAYNAKSYDIAHKSIAYGQFFDRSRTFINNDTNTSIRNEFTRRDYNYYRPSETVPEQQEEIIYMCMQAYDKVGIVRNVIDLMGDFACQGINLVHPNKKIEKFYQKWFKKVNGKERSERFLNLLYRTGNVIVRRFDGKLTAGVADEWKKAYGGDVDVEFDKIDSKRMIIPAKYVFYNPLTVEVIGGELAAFLGKPVFGLKLTSSLRSMISKYQRLNIKDATGELNNLIPQELIQALSSGQQYLPLDQSKLSIFYYKKDDWLVWSNPMIASILDDLIQLDKMKLADMSALDGAMSSVRLWNVGIIDTANLQNSIFPTRATLNKLRDILARSSGGGTLDLVWGPELKFTESNTQVHHFLGPEKYVTTLASIYVGLGVPPALTGSSSDGGFTNNYLSIKTLVERLEYGRERLIEFWSQEIERVQKAMGFRFPANITFDQMVLSDEASEKRLLIDLVDRQLISEETLHGKFDLISEIEKIRIKREHKEHGNNMPPKVSPFHNPDKEHDIKKQFISGGNVAPSEVGMNLLPRKEGEKTPNEQRHETQMELSKTRVSNSGPSGIKSRNGRPKNSNDTTKRKKKRVLPKTKGFMDVLIWTKSAQAEINSIVTPIMLDMLNKKNQRQLTTAELESLETLKFNTLANITPFTPITEEVVYNTINKDFETNPQINKAYTLIVGKFVKLYNKLPVLDEVREMQAYAYAIVNSESY